MARRGRYTPLPASFSRIAANSSLFFSLLFFFFFFFFFPKHHGFFQFLPPSLFRFFVSLFLFFLSFLLFRLHERFDVPLRVTKADFGSARYGAFDQSKVKKVNPQKAHVARRAQRQAQNWSYDVDSGASPENAMP